VLFSRLCVISRSCFGGLGSALPFHYPHPSTVQDSSCCFKGSDLGTEGAVCCCINSAREIQGGLAAEIGGGSTSFFQPRYAAAALRLKREQSPVSS